MHVVGKGTLVHRFWGTYSAGIGIEFQSKWHADDALRTLGEPWKVASGNDRVLVAFVESDALSAIKEQFKAWGLTIAPCGYHHCKDQCRNAEIDNVNHSVDRGACFEMTIPTTPVEQLSLVSP